MKNPYAKEDSCGDGISFFQRYLTLWVFLCMVLGVLAGHFVPEIPEALGKMQLAGISVPIAVLIWIMIYPMMINVDFRSIREIGRNPKGLFLTWIVNWLVKPFTMYPKTRFIVTRYSTSAYCCCCYFNRQERCTLSAVSERVYPVPYIRSSRFSA